MPHEPNHASETAGEAMMICAKIVEAAMLDERERCAKIAEAFLGGLPQPTIREIATVSAIARHIRNVNK